jgi:hypothetical protein
MGWGRTLLLGDIGNRLDIDDIEQDVAALRRMLRERTSADLAQDGRIAALERENEQLQLYLASLLRLLVGKGVIARDELKAFVDVIDEGESR